jgi:hypothetical protein
MNTTTTSNQARRKWALPDLQGLDDREMMMPSSSANSLGFDKDSSRAPFEGMLQSACSGQNVGGDADEMLSIMRMSGSEFHCSPCSIFIFDSQIRQLEEFHPSLRQENFQDSCV